jgi:coproporphyrinogen III oxidase/REP element-mobilizing transposase RayT
MKKDLRGFGNLAGIKLKFESFRYKPIKVMNLEKLEIGNYYHIFNRGVNSSVIFKNEENKHYFLQLIKKHFKSKILVLGYCLMDNHFHLILKINSEEKQATQSLSNLFNAYAKAFNKQESRTGCLFEKHFKRIKIKDEDYLKNLILYIHKNPENHGVIDNFKDHKYTSFDEYTSQNVILSDSEKKYVIELFNDLENFILSHNLKLKDLDLQGFGNLAGRDDKDKNLMSTGSTSTNTAKNVDVDLKGLYPTQKYKKPHSLKDTFFKYIQELQDTISSKLEDIDGKAEFQEDNWKRPEGGGGRTRVIENGDVFEKGGVNISGVHGKLPDSMQKYFGVKDADFFACGLSLVLHPKNPMVPTVHADWRYFEMYDQTGAIVEQWFGGGQDLTPYYLFEEDAQHFHQTCKTACDRHNDDFYKKYKARCDEYFYNAHRNEGRGIGGLFFDYCKASEAMSMQNWYDFVSEVGDSFLDAYVPIVERRKNLPYTKEQRDWQEIRRGRYVEFNLVHDKGTLFGLKTNGRIESILMSLPPHVQWVYDHRPDPGSEEEKLINVLKEPVKWV